MISKNNVPDIKIGSPRLMKQNFPMKFKEHWDLEIKDINLNSDDDNSSEK